MPTSRGKRKKPVQPTGNMILLRGTMTVDCAIYTVEYRRVPCVKGKGKEEGKRRKVRGNEKGKEGRE